MVRRSCIAQRMLHTKSNCGNNNRHCGTSRSDGTTYAIRVAISVTECSDYLLEPWHGQFSVPMCVLVTFCLMCLRICES